MHDAVNHTDSCVRAYRAHKRTDTNSFDNLAVHLEHLTLLLVCCWSLSSEHTDQTHRDAAAVTFCWEVTVASSLMCVITLSVQLRDASLSAARMQPLWWTCIIRDPEWKTCSRVSSTSGVQMCSYYDRCPSWYLKHLFIIQDMKVCAFIIIFKPHSLNQLPHACQ